MKFLNVTEVSQTMLNNCCDEPQNQQRDFNRENSVCQTVD